MDLRYLKFTEKMEKSFPYNVVETAYLGLVKHLNEKYQSERCKTRHEDMINEMLQAHTKLKYFRSFWIRKRNVDFFIPSISGSDKELSIKGYKGLAIEVDGGIHNSQAKMNKDNSKYQQLHRLQIALYTVENDDFKEIPFKQFIMRLRTQQRLDSRARKRVLRNVYLATLASHKDFDFSKYLNSEQIQLLDQIEELL